MKKVKAHLHLPKMKRGDAACISVAPFAHVKGQGVEYHGTVTLLRVKFQVSEPGRQRTLATGQKNVHAWVVGDQLDTLSNRIAPRGDQWRQARYNPKIAGSFLDTKTGEPVHSARAAWMSGPRVFYIPEA